MHKIRRKTTFFTSAIYMFSCQKVFRDTGHNHCHKHQSYLCISCSKTMTVLRLNIYTWSCRFFYYIFRVFCRFNMLFTFLWSNTCSIIPHIGRIEQLKYTPKKPSLFLCYIYVIQHVSVLALSLLTGAALAPKK